MKFLQQGEPFFAGSVLIVQSEITFSIAKKNVIMIGLLVNEASPGWRRLAYFMPPRNAAQIDALAVSASGRLNHAR